MAGHCFRGRPCPGVGVQGWMSTGYPSDVSPTLAPPLTTGRPLSCPSVPPTHPTPDPTRPHPLPPALMNIAPPPPPPYAACPRPGLGPGPKTMHQSHGVVFSRRDRCQKARLRSALLYTPGGTKSRRWKSQQTQSPTHLSTQLPNFQ